MVQNLSVLEKNGDETMKNTVRYTGINAGGDGKFIKSTQEDLRCPSMKPEENVNSIGLEFCKFLVSAKAHDSNPEEILGLGDYYCL